MNQLKDYRCGCVSVEDVISGLSEHGIEQLQTESQSQAFVIGYSREELEIEDIKLS